VLPLVRFNIMNTVNKSMGFSPFQLRMGRSPRVIPPLVERGNHDTAPEAERAYDLIKKLEQISMEAQDNLLRTKISQAAQANKTWTLTFPFAVGGRVRLTMLHRRHEYQGSGEKRVAKFMPRYDGPYTVININEEDSTVTLDFRTHPISSRLFIPLKSFPTLKTTPHSSPIMNSANPQRSPWKMARKNISFAISSMSTAAVVVIVTWFDGSVMGLKKIVG
jgi:hypothetical protein